MFCLAGAFDDDPVLHFESHSLFKLHSSLPSLVQVCELASDYDRVSSSQLLIVIKLKFKQTKSDIPSYKLLKFVLLQLSTPSTVLVYSSQSRNTTLHCAVAKNRRRRLDRRHNKPYFLRDLRNNIYLYPDPLPSDSPLNIPYRPPPPGTCSHPFSSPQPPFPQWKTL